MEASQEATMEATQEATQEGKRLIAVFKEEGMKFIKFFRDNELVYNKRLVNYNVHQCK